MATDLGAAPHRPAATTPANIGHRNARTSLDRSAAAIGLLTVVAANVLYLAGLPLILDPMMSMEPFYVHMAEGSLSSILTGDPAWGPLYALWLKPFSALLADPVAVYTANLYSLSIGVSLLIYAYLLLLTHRVAVAVGAALFFLICDFNVPLFSKVSGFALMVALAALTASELVPAGARRMTVAAAGILLASYARPELYPAALCLWLTAVWLAYRELGESGRRVLVWPAFALACFLILAVGNGTPLFSPSRSSDRLLWAFKEHFAWNWGSWHHQWRDVFSVWAQEFGGAQTMLQAFLNNPLAVVHHLGDNLLGTVRFMATTAFNHYPVLVPPSAAVLLKAERLLASAAVFASLILVVSRPVLRRQMLERYGHTLFVFAILAVFSFASATVIFPVAYCLVIPGVLLLLTGAVAATLLIPRGPRLSWRMRVLAALGCLMAVPRPFVLPSAYEVPGSPFKGRLIVARRTVDTIAFVRSLGLSAPVQVLTLTDGIGEMLGTGFHEVKIWQKGSQPLDTYMRDNGIGMIINLEGGRESFLVNDPYWKLVQETPDVAGFTRLTVPNHETVGLFVRTDLMPKPADPAQTLSLRHPAAGEPEEALGQGRAPGSTP